MIPKGILRESGQFLTQSSSERLPLAADQTGTDAHSSTSYRESKQEGSIRSFSLEVRKPSRRGAGEDCGKQRGQRTSGKQDLPPESTKHDSYGLKQSKTPSMVSTWVDPLCVCIGCQFGFFCGIRCVSDSCLFLGLFSSCWIPCPASILWLLLDLFHLVLLGLVVASLSPALF